MGRADTLRVCRAGGFFLHGPRLRLGCSLSLRARKWSPNPPVADSALPPIPGRSQRLPRDAPSSDPRRAPGRRRHVPPRDPQSQDGETYLPPGGVSGGLGPTLPPRLRRPGLCGPPGPAGGGEGGWTQPDAPGTDVGRLRGAGVPTEQQLQREDGDHVEIPRLPTSAQPGRHGRWGSTSPADGGAGLCPLAGSYPTSRHNAEPPLCSMATELSCREPQQPSWLGGGERQGQGCPCLYMSSLILSPVVDLESRGLPQRGPQVSMWLWDELSSACLGL